MKKKLMALLLGPLGVMLMVGMAQAIPFSSTGWVNPNHNGSWDKNTLTGTAQYTFRVLDNQFTDPGGIKRQVQANMVELSFESDVFDTTNLGLWSFTSLTSGWTISAQYNGDNTGIWVTARTDQPSAYVTANTQPLTLSIDYKLLSSDRFYFSDGTDSSGNKWDWYEAQGGEAWEQEYLLSYSYLTKDPWLGYQFWTPALISGGSTAPVPEPGTVMLLGSGLLGLIYLKRQKRKSQQ